ncbi:MAG: phosphoribosylformylglycinamidine synthase [Clostridiales Family XIII bacterium]|jgi:phosphoribosylformylglycinamidine synthase|nr:phosphoribosylformylglycinamidine synthase [Clostridiales Family XIII bacterium]
MIRRIFVEKKPGFDAEAQGLLAELRENLGVGTLKSLRVINRYDIENIEDDVFEASKTNVFAEPNVDNITEEKLIVPPDAYVFGIAYLPGQFDQRADSAMQCLKLIHGEANVLVSFAKILVLQGDLMEDRIAEIKKYCINPVDSQEVTDEKPKTLSGKIEEIRPIETIEGFCEMEESALRRFLDEKGFAMGYRDLVFTQEYFRVSEQREPTITELRVIDTYWSDHCRHTTFLTELTDIRFEGEGAYVELIETAFDAYLEMRREVYGEGTRREITLMDMATIGAKYIKKKGLLEDLDESDEVNASSIRVKADIKDSNGKKRKEDWLVMFKNETHNHPTEIEPFGGAATCLGGAIRDPLSGRTYVYQAMRVTGGGDPRTPVRKTIAGKLAQYQIAKGAARGYSSYGNQIGLATGLVDEIYDEGYVAKRMEIGAVIGAAPAENVYREKPQVGDRILIVGGRTGRDGLGGATGSSKAHTETSVMTAGAEVQKGNPLIERNIQRLFRRPEVTRLIKKCNDFGAGGIAVAIGELAESIDVNLDKVPKKYEGMDGTELALSESQERMAVLISHWSLDEFRQYAQEENVEVTSVAKVTDTGRFRMKWQGARILDLSREFLDTNGVRPEREVVVRDLPELRADAFIHTSLQDDLNKDALISSMGTVSTCSRKGLIEYFDSTIGRGSVLMPLGGKYQLTPAMGMVGKLPVVNGETDTVTYMAYGFDPKIAKQSPYHSAIFAVLNSITKIVAMGGELPAIRLTFQEYFEKLGKVPSRWAKPFSALLGALDVQRNLDIPAIGGKDSMSGTFNHLDVPPTLVSFAVAVGSAKRAISPEFKEVGSSLIYVKSKKNEHYIPDYDAYKAAMIQVGKLIGKGKVLAAATIERGGIFTTAAKMALGNGIGARLTGLTREELTSTDYGSLLLEIPSSEDPESLFKKVDYHVIGETIDESVLEVDMEEIGVSDVRIKLSVLESRWMSTLETVYPTDIPNSDDADNHTETISFAKRNKSIVKPGIAKPLVFIPVFPGTNCEGDTKAAFEEAGGEVELVNLICLNETDLDRSIRDMAEVIKKCQIIAIPGGFSGGDEPDGSAKFITAVFRNPYIKEVVEELLEKRDGLMLGICNGFQALIKLGLLPHGHILPPGETAPTLTYNTIGRHVSKIVRTRVASVLSPWLADANIGDIHSVPVSHTEGRFVANDEVIATLVKNGQIATQYVGLTGAPTMDIRYNPNGSLLAVEGITSPDGRIFGKMGHSERAGKNLYKNVPGNYDSGIFRSGIRYFE